MARATVLRALLLGAAVVAAECALAAVSDPVGGWPVRLVLAFGLGTAVVAARLIPLAGVAVLVLVEVAGLLAGATIAADELAVAVVVYQCARHGGPTTLWVSGILVPTAYVLSGAFLANAGTDAAQRIGQSGLTDDPVAIALLLVTVASPLAIPWLLGLTLRWRARAERERHALVAARAEAEAKEHQARLARDVHDVVGHSLVVILRQADSVRFLSDQVPPAVLEVVDNISSSARASLTEVRHVLSAGASRLAASDLDELITSIPPGVATVRDRVLGSPRPLPPDTASVAHRVLQEMLTNALKHGDGDEIDVLRDWRDGLRLVVSNPAVEAAGDAGMGLAGMRQRLLVVDGSLEVRHDRSRFSVEARIPLRGGTRTA